MRLVLDVLRHGDALPDGPGGDASRPLSPAGAAQLARLSRALAAAAWRPERVIASPYVRARSSAEAVLAALGDRPAVEIEEALIPDSDPDDCLRALEAIAGHHRHLLIVSHLPLVARICNRLTGASPVFRPGDIARCVCRDGLLGGAAQLEGVPGVSRAEGPPLG